MSLFREGGSSPAVGEISPVEDVLGTEKTDTHKVVRETGTSVPKADLLPQDILIATYKRAASFHEQEIREQDARATRGAGMGPEVVALHENALERSMDALLKLGVAEWIPLPLEVTPDERRTTAPALAMPELSPAAA